MPRSNALVLFVRRALSVVLILQTLICGKPCPAGFYNDTDSGSCFPCGPGKYQNEQEQTSCKLCQSGQYQPFLKITSGCEPCVSGRYARVGMPYCSLCPAGKWGGGGHQQSSEETACYDCPVGMYTEVEGTPEITGCQYCSVGRFTSNVTGARCVDCPSGWYQDRSDTPKMSCHKCPIGFAALVDSNGNKMNRSARCQRNNITISCKSSSKYLNNTSADMKEWHCERCPQGALCEGDKTAWDGLKPLFGWWKIPASERSGIPSWKAVPAFAKCIYSPACLGAPNRALQGRHISKEGVDLALVGIRNATLNLVCATDLGFRNGSRLCSGCDEAHRPQIYGECTKCSELYKDFGSFMLGLGILFPSILSVYVVRTIINDAGKLTASAAMQKSFVSYMQISAMVVQIPVVWAISNRNLFIFQSSLSTIGEAIFELQCSYPSSSRSSMFYTKQATFAMLPFLVMTFSYMYWLCFGCLKGVPFRGSQEKSGSMNPSPSDKCSITVSSILYLMYPTIVLHAFQIFDCTNIGGLSYLTIDRSQECYRGSHLASIVLLGCSQLFLYVIGLPALMLLILRCARRQRKGLQQKYVLVRFGVFYAHYKDNYYFWEIVLVLRKVFMVAIILFGRQYGVLRQVQLSQLGCLACIIVELQVSPYHTKTDDHKIFMKLEVLSLLSLWMTVWCTELIHESQTFNDGGMGMIGSFLIVIISLSMMGFYASHILYRYSHENKDTKAGKVGLILFRRMKTLRKTARTSIAILGSKQIVEVDNPISPNVKNQSFGLSGIEMYNDVTATTKRKQTKKEKQKKRIGVGAKKEVPHEKETKTVKSSELPPGWQREYDESTASYYLYNEETGDAIWEDEYAKDDSSQKDDAHIQTRQNDSDVYTEFFTDDGESFYMLASGEGEPLWHLPEGAVLAE